MYDPPPPEVVGDESRVEWMPDPPDITSAVSGPSHLRCQDRRKEDHMKPLLSLAVFSLIICSPARAQQYEHATALLCDTQRQVERYVALFNGEEKSAINAVNTEEQNSTACALETVAFMRGRELGTARNKESAFQMVRILVVGVETPSGLRSIRPSVYFSAFKVVEYDV
jgi:hypothetical protein